MDLGVQAMTESFIGWRKLDKVCSVCQAPATIEADILVYPGHNDLANREGRPFVIQRAFCDAHAPIPRSELDG